MDQARLKEVLKEAALRLIVGPEEPEEITPGCEQGELYTAELQAMHMPEPAADTISASGLSRASEAAMNSISGPVSQVKSAEGFVLNRLDIWALIFVVAILSTQTLLSGGCSWYPLVVTAIYAFLNTFWFADVTLRLHRATGRANLSSRYERLALLHPMLLCPALFAMAYFSACLFLGPVIMLVGLVIGLGAVGRWAYLVCDLPSHSGLLAQGKSEALQGRACDSSAMATLATVISVPLFGTMWYGAHANVLLPAISILFSGYAFISLRNVLINLDPAAKLDWTGEFTLSARRAAADEELIRYNHFVQIQKWSKRRFALRSGWKIILPVLILFAAVAANLHGVILDALAGSVSWSGTLKDNLGAGGGYTSGAYTGANALANYWLVYSIVASSFLFFATGLLSFLRAPKQVAAGKNGISLVFSRFSTRGEKVISWSSIKHIKLVRPRGKTSAGDDRLVFERFQGAPLSLKLAGISSAEDRDKLLGAINLYGQEISREAAIEETLRKPLQQNYTELWLQALAAPPKREKLKPLIEGVSLNEDRYEIIRALGSGGQGFAYLALDRSKNKEVVLKESVLPVYVDINARRQALANFEKEAKLLTRLDHEQVVKLEGFFVEDHRAYLVLEHIDGESLRQLVQREGPLAEKQISELARQMCSILSYLHGLSPPLVHRDFTPDNLILHKDGTLKLIDFNVAQQVELATTGTVVGKQAYLPPEQFRGQAEPASDLYAMGATLYFLAAGKDPTPISVARPIKEGLKISKRLDNLISTLTQLVPGDRPENPDVVATILQGKKSVSVVLRKGE